MNSIQPETVTDPVCKMQKKKSEMKVTSIFKNLTYYFCSEQDKEIFDAHPEYWIPREEKA